MDCPKCGSKSWKNGKASQKQRYKCKSCSYQFTQANQKGKPQAMKWFASLLYMGGLSMRFIARIFGVSPQSALNWIREFAQENYEKPEPGTSIVMELDEMWHYLGKKNKNSGYGRLLIELQADWLIGNWGIVTKIPSESFGKD